MLLKHTLFVIQYLYRSVYTMEDKAEAKTLTGFCASRTLGKSQVIMRGQEVRWATRYKWKRMTRDSLTYPEVNRTA